MELEEICINKPISQAYQNTIQQKGYTIMGCYQCPGNTQQCNNYLGINPKDVNEKDIIRHLNIQ